MIISLLTLNSITRPTAFVLLKEIHNAQLCIFDIFYFCKINKPSWIHKMSTHLNILTVSVL